MFVVNEFYRSTNGSVLRCIRGWDGQYDFTFRYDDGEFRAEYTDKDGSTAYGMRMLPDALNITSLIAELESKTAIHGGRA